MLKQIYSFNIYKQQIGLYSKEKVNSNGYWLLEFSQSNHIRLIHTLFVYKKCNCSALESKKKKERKKKNRSSYTQRKYTYRNQIYYVFVKKIVIQLSAILHHTDEFI